MVIATNPERAGATIAECAELGIDRVFPDRAFPPPLVAKCRDWGTAAIVSR